MQDVYTEEFRSKYKCECGMLIESLDQVQFGEEGEELGTLFPYIKGDMKEFVARDLKTGKVYRTKRCKNCKSILPSKVGVVTTFKIGFAGMKGTGKTVYSLALEKIMEVINQSDFAQKEKMYIRNIACDTSRYNYRAKMLESFNRGVLPEPTPFLEKEFHIPFEIHNGSTQTDAIMLLYDMAGEIFNETLKGTSNLLEADALFYIVDGTQLRNKDALLRNQECFRNIVCGLKKFVPVYLILTKTDLLSGYSEEGISYSWADTEFVLPNSLRRQGATYRTIHEEGYDEIDALHNQLYARYLFEHASINLYEDLMTMMPKELIFPFAVSAYSPQGGCFSVENPLMHFLAKKSLVPYKEV